MKAEAISVEGHYGDIGEVLTKKQKKRGLLIHAFQKMQKEFNYMPEDRFKELSRNLGVPLSSDVYSTAFFYKHFYFKPRGKNIVCVCMGPACRVRGAAKAIRQKRRL